MTNIFVKRGNVETDIQEEVHMKMKTEDGMILPHQGWSKCK
jgi:hypothetical protein